MNSNKNVSKKKRECDFFYNFVKITGAVPALLWARQKVYHISDGKLIKRKKIKGGVLICSNHIAFTDPLFLNCVFWYRRVYFLAMQELFNTPLKRFFFNSVKCIPVDRSNFSMATFHTVTDRLKSGKAVLIFPEGQVALVDVNHFPKIMPLTLVAEAFGQLHVKKCNDGIHPDDLLKLYSCIIMLHFFAPVSDFVNIISDFTLHCKPQNGMIQIEI